IIARNFCLPLKFYRRGKAFGAPTASHWLTLAAPATYRTRRYQDCTQSAPTAMIGGVSTMRHRILISAFALACYGGLQSHAQEHYPSKPIHFILAQPAGGAVDLISRALAARLSESLQQSVVVENMPGANGGLAGGTVARAAPDGYTLFMAVDNN